MDGRKTELRRLKKQSDQIKRKYVTGWKTATIIALVLAVLLAPMCMFATAYDNELAQKFGGSFWKLKNPAPDTYTAEEPDGQLLLQTQTEGIVLLKNENAALPLEAGTRLDGYGSIADTALVQMGFRYDVQADTMLLSLSGTEGTGEYDREDLQNALNAKASGRIKTLIVLISAQVPANPELLKNDAIDAILWCGGAEAEALARVLTGVSPSGSLVNAWVNGQDKNHETRYADFVMHGGDFRYAEQVAYPFGYGLSYTEFTYSDFKAEYDTATDSFGVSVTVTNGGDTPGKETVQIYAQTPYTDYDKQYAIEKPAVSLVGFGKTEELAPGASETVTVYVNKGDLAFYDARGTGNYILDAGNYYLTVATDAHNAVNNILAAKGCTPESTENRMDGEGNTALTYSWKENILDTKTYAVSENSGLPGEKTAYSPADYPDVAMPTLGAKNGLRLYDMPGLAYDDPKWQTLLDQLTFDDMLRLVTDGYGVILPVKSVQSPGAKKGEGTFPVSESLLAATFDTELFTAVGKYLGNTALSDGTPVQQLHMEDLEDPFVAEQLCATVAEGMAEKGVAAVLENGGCAIRTAEEIPTAEGILSGITSYNISAFDALSDYENDPVIVTALRQACHNNLYTIANSAAMNGIGADTVVQVRMLPVVFGLRIALAVCAVLTAVLGILWHRGRKKWQNSAEHMAYKALKTEE